MEITQEQYELIADCFPVQRGNVKLSNLEVLNAILYVAEHGCKWRGLPQRFGNWHTIYVRMNRWAKNGVLDRVFRRLQQKQLIRINDETRQLAHKLGYTPVIPPKSNRTRPWDYNREIYKRRNEIERLFRRLKAYRRIFSRFDKLDVLFLGFITFALIHDALRSVNTP